MKYILLILSLILSHQVFSADTKNLEVKTLTGVTFNVQITRETPLDQIINNLREQGCFDNPGIPEFFKVYLFYNGIRYKCYEKIIQDIEGLWENPQLTMIINPHVPQPRE